MYIYRYIYQVLNHMINILKDMINILKDSVVEHNDIYIDIYVFRHIFHMKM